MPDILVVFDMDGVLLDLNLNTEKVRSRIRAEFGRRGITAEFHPLISTINKEVERLEKKNAAAAGALLRIAWQIIDEEEMEAATGATAREGAVDLLTRLDGAVLALYTNNSRECARTACEQAGIPVARFSNLYCRSGCNSLKPSHQPLVDALATHNNYTLSKIVMVGDHPYDMQSLRSFKEYLDRSCGNREIQCFAIGIAKDKPGVRILRESGADYVTFSLVEVGDLILG